MKRKLLSDLNLTVLDRKKSQFIKGGNIQCCIGTNCVDCGEGATCTFTEHNGTWTPGCGGSGSSTQ